MWFIVVQLLSGVSDSLWPEDYSMPDSPVLHCLLEFPKGHLHWAVMLSNHLILCHPLLLLPSVFPSIVFCFHELTLCINQVAKILALQLRQQFFQRICRVDFLYNWLVWSPCCPRESQESSPTPKFKSINYLVLSLLYGPTLNPNMTIGETMTLTVWTFVDKVMSLLLKMLSKFVIAFLPRSKCLLNSWLQLSTAEILGPKKVESVIASTFPHLFAMNCWDKMPWS